MNRFELRGIDQPLLRRDLQALQQGRQSMSDESTFLPSDYTTGRVHEFEVILPSEENSVLVSIAGAALKVQQGLETSLIV